MSITRIDRAGSPDRNMCRMLASLLAALSASVVLSSPAAAEIRCDGRFQIVRGESLATPYCEDEYLAAVARGYGVRVSGRAVRNDPSVKASVCRFVGGDPRVQDICIGYREQIRPFF